MSKRTSLPLDGGDISGSGLELVGLCGMYPSLVAFCLAVRTLTFCQLMGFSVLNH